MSKKTKEQLQELNRNDLEEFAEFLLQQNEQLEEIKKQWLVKEKELKNLNKFRREKDNLESELKRLEKEKIETENQKQKREVERKKLVKNNRELVAEKVKIDLELESTTRENIELLAKNEILKEKNKELREEIKFNKQLQESDQKLFEELNAKNENLEKILLQERAVWEKKESAGINAVKEIVRKYNELLEINKELEESNQELAGNYVKKLKELADLQEENNALQNEINRNLLISNSDSEVKISTFDEEFAKVSQLEKIQMRNAELEKQLEENRQNLDEVRKATEITKERLTQDLAKGLEEVKQLRIKLQEKNDAFTTQQKNLEAAQIQQEILNKKLEESEQLLQKFQSEKVQEIENLKLNSVLLNQRTQEAEKVWQVKVSEINVKLHETRVKLGNLLGKQEEEKLSKEELYQEAQILKEGLKTSKLNEKILDKQIIKLESEIIVVSRKLAEIKNERDNNSSLLLHYRTKNSSLEKARNDLFNEYEKLTKLYNQSKQEAGKLAGQIKILEKDAEQEIINKENIKRENIKLQEETAKLGESLKIELQNKSTYEKNYQKLVRSFEEKINGLEKQVKDLMWASEEIRQQLIDELTEVKRKLVKKETEFVELENREKQLKSDQTKIKELEIIYKETIKNLTSRLNFILWDQKRKKAFIGKLKIKVEKKKQRLKTLNNKIISLQSQLKNVNGAISQQNKKLEQKNHQLTDLLGQLEEKHKLVDDLQREIKKIESQKSSEISKKEKKIEQLQEELKEKDKIIAVLKDKPPLVSETNSQNAKDVSLASESDLLELIEHHRKEVQRLKSIIGTQARSTTLSEVESETSLKETIQDLPKKNSSTLYLSLLGGSLMTISLGLNLLKNKLKGKKNW